MGDVLEERGEIIEEPLTLVGQPFHFKVLIQGASLLEYNWKKVYVEYEFKNQQGAKIVYHLSSYIAPISDLARRSVRSSTSSSSTASRTSTRSSSTIY